MSWTSEFEPPPPRPLLEPEDFNEQGFELVELEHDPDAPPEADLGDDAEPLPDGPLDPSVFDGLFDDLSDDDANDDGRDDSAISDDTAEHHTTQDDNGLDSDLDIGVDEDPDIAVEVDADLEVEDDLDADLDVDADLDALPEAAIDYSNIDADFDSEPEDFGSDDQDDDVSGEAAGSDDVSDKAAASDEDAVFDDDDVVESSEDLLHEVIQQNPGLTEPLPEHLDPAPFQPDELEQIDAAFLEGESAFDSNGLRSATVFQPEVGVEDDGPTQGSGGSDYPSDYPNRSETQADPVDHFPNLTEPAPQPPLVHYDPSTEDDVPVTAARPHPAEQLDSGEQLRPSTSDQRHGGDQRQPGDQQRAAAQAQAAQQQPYPAHQPYAGQQQAYATGQQYAAEQPAGVDAHTTGNVPSLAADGRSRRRWPAFAVATVIGASLGVAGALVLFQFLRPGTPEVAAPAPETPVRTSVTQASETTVDAGSEQAVGLASLAATGRFELNTVRFVPGTTDLTAESDAVLVEAAEAIADQPAAPLCIDVRTFSESTALANRELSGRQGLRIQDRLVELGVPVSSIMVNPLGAAPLTEAQPVQTFVVPSSGLQPSGLRSAAQQVNPFAIGLDPITNQLRPESIQPLNLLGQAMLTDEAATLSLAAYSFSEAAVNRNDEMASVAAEAAAAYLVTNHNVDRRRITILTPGQTPFAVGPAMGGHIFVQWGAGAAVNRDLEALDLASISFAPGSARLTGEAVAALDQVATIGAEREVALVIGVHTATESTEDANSQLSAIQAQSLLEYLLAGGLDEERVQVYGSGNMRQFQGQDVPSGIVIAAIP